MLTKLDAMLIQRDCTYFVAMTTTETTVLLAKHEQAGTLREFISNVAPDYISPLDGEVDKWVLLGGLQHQRCHSQTSSPDCHTHCRQPV